MTHLKHLALGEVRGGLAHDDRDVARIPDGADAERTRHAHAHLELLVVRVVGPREALRDHDVAAAGLLELSHHVGAGLGGRLPVDVAPLVARLVLAKGVKRDIAVGQVPGRAALEVVHEAGARRGDRDGARMHEELGRLGPDQFAAHQPDRVGADAAHGTDCDDAAMARRDRELVHEAALAPEARHGDRGEALADRHLDRGPEHTARRGLVTIDFADCAVADDHARVGDPQVDDERVAADQVDHRDEDQQQAGPGEGDELDPVEQVADDERDRHRRRRSTSRGA